MKTKDQIIDELSKLVLRLLKTGQEEFQKVTELFCEIEVMKEEAKNNPVLDCDLSKVISIEEHKKVKICPKCKERPRHVLRTGRVSGYCKECDSENQKNKYKKFKEEMS